MTRCLAMDDNNDIFIGSDGSLAVATGVDAVMFACAGAAQAQLGEMIYALDEGMPNFQTVWNGAPNVRQFEAALRRTLLGVADVVSIVDVTIETLGDVLSYSATIETIYGVGVING
jgi:hypothetical protein